MREYHCIQNLTHIQVYNQEDFHDMKEDMNILLAHLFLYIDYLVHTVMEHKEYKAQTAQFEEELNYSI